VWLVQLNLEQLRVRLATRHPREFDDRDVDYWLRRHGFERIETDEFAYTGDPYRVIPQPDEVIIAMRKM